MALIRCAECGNAVSTSAASCPKCGAPIASAASSATSMAPPTPFIPFWNTSRIVGAVLCSIGALTLVFGFVYMTSLESQFRRNFQDWDPVSYISLVVGCHAIACRYLDISWRNASTQSCWTDHFHCAVADGSGFPFYSRADLAAFCHPIPKSELRTE